jgi:PAS domain S-box-containing protein
VKRPGRKLADIVDVARLQRICDDYVEAGGMALAVLDPDGTVLVASGWQDICTQYHRRNDTTLAACLESDLRINERVLAGLEAPRHVAYRCANGLWDVAFPLVVDGEHLATLFTGQFFYDDDDLHVEWFRRRAHELGFDERDYIDALGRVPVVAHQRVQQTMCFLADLVGMLGEFGSAAISRDKDREILRAVLDAVPVRVFWKDRDLKYLGCNVPFARDAGFENPEDLVGRDDYAMGWREQADLYRADDLLVIDSGEPRLLVEEPQTTPSGERIDLLTSKLPLRDARDEVIGVLGTYYDITARKRAERALRQNEELLRGLFDTMPSGAAIYEVRGDGSKGSDYIVKDFNATSLRIEGKTKGEVVGKSLLDLRPTIDDYGLIPVFQRVWQTGEPALFSSSLHVDEHYTSWYENRVFRLPSGEIVAIYDDVTERVRAEEELRRISWMLSPQHPTGSGGSTPAYGDLARFNTRRVILDAIPRERLEDIASDYVGLLESSAAVYEANGDYALGIFASGWCRYLDAASRRLCPGDDEAALRSGLWLCHESCWSSASSLSIDTRKPVDIACHGGLRLYAVPVFAGDDVVGSINIGYGDPPRDPERLRELAEKYQVDAGELARLADAYESRPPFVIDQAKRRLESSARLIGALVETQRSHDALRQSQRQYETFINATDDMAFLKDDELRHVIANAALAAFFGRGIEDVVGRTDEELMPAAAAEACRATDLRALRQAGLLVTTEKQGARVYESRKFPVALTDGRVGVAGTCGRSPSSAAPRARSDASPPAWSGGSNSGRSSWRRPTASSSRSPTPSRTTCARPCARSTVSARSCCRTTAACWTRRGAATCAASSARPTTWPGSWTDCSSFRGSTGRSSSSRTWT